MCHAPTGFLHMPSRTATHTHTHTPTHTLPLHTPNPLPWTCSPHAPLVPGQSSAFSPFGSYRTAAAAGAQPPLTLPLDAYLPPTRRWFRLPRDVPCDTSAFRFSLVRLPRTGDARTTKHGRRRHAGRLHTFATFTHALSPLSTRTLRRAHRTPGTDSRCLPASHHYLLSTPYTPG